MPENLEELINRWDDAGLPDLSEFRIKKDICAFCLKNHIYQTYEKYLLKGNICEGCTYKINKLIKENDE